jgi:hypothetical protein
MTFLKIYLLPFLIAIYSCRQDSPKIDLTPVKPESKKIISEKEIYDFMQMVITEQKLSKENGLSIEPRDRCDPSLEDATFLRQLLNDNSTDTSKNEEVYDTSDWKSGKIAISNKTGFRQLDKYLTSDDVRFMLQQKNDHIDFTWDNAKLGFKILNHSGWYAFSIPLFSKDRTKAVLMIQDLCPGLCGTGWTLLYKKENNEWTSQIGNRWLH